MLEYDNSAFYYFSITLLGIYLIPGLYFLVSEVFQAFLGSGDIGANARTGAEKTKAKKLKATSTGFARLKSNAFLINLAVLVVALPTFIYLVTLVQNDGAVSTFDPFSILGIDQGASMAEIKKAYRKLSLKYHPDRNINNKLAQEMFVKVTKAHEALTDPESKKNFEMYGNPDGKQSLEVSIGLPSALLTHPKIVLVLYLIVMVVLIPAGVGFWYAISKQFGEKNIMHETYTSFYQLIQESHRVKNIFEIMAASAEFRSLNAPKPQDAEPLSKLYNKMKNEKLMPKPKYEHPNILRGNLLLHAHTLRLTESFTPAMKADLDAMLRHAPELVDGIIEISYQRKWLEAAFAAIQFSQCIVQGLWYTNNPLQQVPHLTNTEISAITKSSKDPSKAFWEYIRTPDAEKKGLTNLTSEQKQDIFNACQVFPCLKIETQLFVEEPDVDPDTNEVIQDVNATKIFEQDLVTLRVTLTHENGGQGKKKESPPVHAPLFPKTIREHWWLVLTETSKIRKPGMDAGIHAVEKVTETTQVTVHDLRFMAPPRFGHYEMELHVYSDCYMGLDEMIVFSFDVSPASELPEYKPHPEDVKLDDEPTLFEQVMAANADESSDDEDEPKKEQKKLK